MVITAEDILRGAADHTAIGQLTELLDSKKPLRVKYGIDPTSPDVHLGHTVPLRKLRHFQAFGHHPVIIIGDYTARIGDPTGRNDTRPPLTPAQIEHNAQNYLEQIGRVIDLKAAEVRYNSEWFSTFTGQDWIELMARYTTQQLLAREDFSKRMKEGVPIYHHELLYPILQAYDSMRIDADVELGGTEQKFNLLLGRDYQEKAGKPPQVCIMMPILRGLDGTRKMGKSLDNYISIRDSAEDMFGKVMSIPDELMSEWYTLLTDDELSPTAHPMESKRNLAILIATQYHTAEAVAEAATSWSRQFSDRLDPLDIPVVTIPKTMVLQGKVSLPQLIHHMGFAASRSEAGRLMQNGGVTLGPVDAKVKQTDPKSLVAIEDDTIIRVGKRQIAKLRNEK